VTLLSSLQRLARPALTAVSWMLLATVVAAQDRYGPNPPASSYGWRHDELFLLITILTSLSFLVVLVMLVWPILFHRARPGRKAVYDHGSSLHDKRFTAVVSVIVFVVLDAWVLVIAMQDLREAQWNIPTMKENQEIIRVQVLAQQWAWNFRQPGVDGKFGTPDDIVTINELTLPASAKPEHDYELGDGRPVVLNLSSKDVIHSFFVPDMRIKRDANPGSINEAWFMPIKDGEFDILCAELCGYAHYQMFGMLHVLEQDVFDAWEQEASHMALAAYDENDPEALWAWNWQE
jgi:cytochrome c oxidase subunit 2